jgi:hypothetical protein
MAHSDPYGAARRRSKSTGSSVYGSRIAQVFGSLNPLQRPVTYLYHPALGSYPDAPLICGCKGGERKRESPTIT